MKPLLLSTLALLLAGCVHSPPTSSHPVISSRDELDAHVGQVVILRGVVSNTKIPTILGVDVQSSDPDLRGQTAEAVGVLQRSVVTEEDLARLQRNGPVANRGPGVFYRLRAVDSNDEAPARRISRQ